MRGARIAVITGASSGLGRAFALEAGRLGDLDEIWLIARRRENLDRLAGELPVKGRALSLDLLAEDSFADQIVPSFNQSKVIGKEFVEVPFG